MILVENLRKHFGSIKAVDGVSFRVEPGEIYGLLGPNGAGKSTTINCIAGLLRPEGGTIRLDSVDAVADPMRARRILGVVPQETAIYDTLSARENVAYFAALYGVAAGERRSRVDEALERVGLEPSSKQQAKKFSGGMKRRLNLAIGLVSHPKVLLLDEPTVGIDPQARVHILDVVREVAAAGTAVLYTTHYLEEAEILCRRVGIVDHGRILSQGSIAELRAEVGEGMVLILRGHFTIDQFEKATADLTGTRRIDLREGAAMLAVTGVRPAPELLSSLLSRGLEISDVTMQEPSLQSLFIKLTGRDLRD